MLGVHSGFTEDQIDEFSYKFYKNCILELGLKFNFESLSNILGNSYANAMDSVNAANPLNYAEEGQKKPQRMTKDMAMAFMGISNAK